MYLQNGVNTLICIYDRLFYWGVISASLHWYSRLHARRDPGLALGLASGRTCIPLLKPLLAPDLQKPQLLKVERMARLRVETADMTRRKVRSSRGLEVFRRLISWWNRSQGCKEAAGWWGMGA